jgi:hypothetical protein
MLENKSKRSDMSYKKKIEKQRIVFLKNVEGWRC